MLIKRKLEVTVRKISEAIKYSPMEILLGVTFFVIWLLFRNWDYNYMKEATLMLFPLFVCFIFICNRLFKSGFPRIIYYVSFLLFLPFLFIDIDGFVWSSGYYYSLLIAVIAIISCGWYRDNKLFTSNAVRTLVNFISSVLISYALCLAIIAIYASITYIFNIRLSDKFDFDAYAFAFTGYISLPIAFLSFNHYSDNNEFQPSKVFDILLNFILSPAVIIYTCILYVYFTKIVILWELPKGNIAYMVFSFILSVVIGQACQPLLKQRYYDWFYTHFSYLSIPPLVMFWIGVSHRIQEYGLTEDRVYLLLLGVLATLCMCLFLFKRMSHYLYIALASIFILSFFTFIPTFSAKQIGLNSQLKRLDEIIVRLNIADSVGKLHKTVAEKDTTYKDNYRELYNIYSYIAQSANPKWLKEKYGFEDAQALCESIIPSALKEYVMWGGKITSVSIIQFKRNFSIDISGYSSLHNVYPHTTEKTDNTYHSSFEDGILTVTTPLKEDILKLDMNQYVSNKLKSLKLTPSDIPNKKLEMKKDSLLYMKIGKGLLIFNNITLEADSPYQVKSVKVDYLLVK